MELHQLLAEWSQWFWPLFANHLWQATLFALIAWIAARLLTRATAHIRHLLWLLAFVKFLFPSVFLIVALRAFGIDVSRLSALIAGNAGGADFMLRIAEPIIQTVGNGTGGSHKEIYCALTFWWLIGATLFLSGWLVRRWRLAQILSGGEVIAGGHATEIFERESARLNLTRPVTLVTTTEIQTGGKRWEASQRARQPRIFISRGRIGQAIARKARAVNCATSGPFAVCRMG